MLFQVGGQGPRPTFFEMAAAQQLPSSLRAAVTYSFESLYGLRRRGVKIRLKKPNVSAGSSDEIHHTGLQKRQKVLSVVFLVVLPYFKSKLQSAYNSESEATIQATLWGDRLDGTGYIDEGNNSISFVDNSDSETSARVHLIKRLQKTVGACYPWLHAGNEGLSFAYQLLYLLDATGFYSLGLHALGIHVCRATGQELMDSSSRISKLRSHERQRLRGPPWLKALQGGLLSCVYAILDYAQTGLIAAVFFFKVAKEGIPLPPDRALCPLCLQKRTNPSVMAVSGFVFCYTCLFKYTSQYKRCPVTIMPATVDQIRRLFHDV